MLKISRSSQYVPIPSPERRKRLERIADVLFLLCPTMMVAVRILLAYEII